MMGTMFCQYETPCGWCVRLNKECTEKGGCKPKRKKAAAALEEQGEKLLNPTGEYAAKFAENHGISFSEAMSAPMVKAFAELPREIQANIMRSAI